ncbi:MAG: FAD:protein FMN transferase [Actinobacteria bacterium]|nr:FAD:protein FMN transferase [Actinomycetota bacterium]
MRFHSARFDAIGVTNQVTVTDPWLLDAALDIARDQVAALDLAASRFRDDSELAELNRRGRLRVSPLLLEAIGTAIRAARDTGGLVDPTIGAALRGLGYDRDFDVVASRGVRPEFELVPATGWRSVQVEGDVVSLRPGTELDLGATAKAWAADRIARRIREATGAEVLVSLGGDVAAAGAPHGGWPVRVSDSSRRDEGGQVVAVRGGGLATSSTTVRRWRAGDAELHHIVDPRTGAPATEVWRTVSVVARSCAEANTASTAAILLGDGAVSWLEARGLHARLVRPDGAVVTTGGWPRSHAEQRQAPRAAAPRARRSGSLEDIDPARRDERERGRRHVRSATAWVAAAATGATAFLVATLGLTHKATPTASITTTPATRSLATAHPKVKAHAAAARKKTTHVTTATASTQAPAAAAPAPVITQAPPVAVSGGS